MVRTHSGISLMNWHSALLRLLARALVDCVADGTEWFAKRIRGPLFYLAFLALFVTEGILFENFLVSDADEMRFTRARVIPSFERAVELFGVRPLIVRLLPVDSEDSHHWQCSPGWLHERAKALTSGGSNGQ